MDDVTQLNILRLTRAAEQLQENIHDVEEQSKIITTALDEYKKRIADNEKSN